MPAIPSFADLISFKHWFCRHKPVAYVGEETVIIYCEKCDKEFGLYAIRKEEK